MRLILETWRYSAYPPANSQIYHGTCTVFLYQTLLFSLYTFCLLSRVSTTLANLMFWHTTIDKDICILFLGNSLIFQSSWCLIISYECTRTNSDKKCYYRHSHAHRMNCPYVVICSVTPTYEYYLNIDARSIRSRIVQPASIDSSVIIPRWHGRLIVLPRLILSHKYPDSKARWANVGPTWSRQDPCWANVGQMKFAVGVGSLLSTNVKKRTV